MASAISAKPGGELDDETSSMNHHRTHDLITLEDAQFNELKSIKKQLYSAAEYFESSYNSRTRSTKLVMESLKDYTLKALVNTVDHLGSMAFTVNTNLANHINAQIARLDLRLDCLQQRVGTWRGFAGLGGVSQQSLTTDTPTYHKRYISISIAENGHSHRYRFQPESGASLPSPLRRSPASFIWEEECFVSQPPDLPPNPMYTSWKSDHTSSEASPNNVDDHHNLIPQSGSLRIRRPISATHCYRSSRRRTTSLPVERGCFTAGTSWEEEADDHQYSGKGKRLLKEDASLQEQVGKKKQMISY